MYFFLVRYFFASQPTILLSALDRIPFKQYQAIDICHGNDFRVNIRADDSLLNDTLIKHFRLEVGWLISVGERGYGRKGLMKVVARETAVSQEPVGENQCLWKPGVFSDALPILRLVANMHRTYGVSTVYAPIPREYSRVRANAVVSLPSYN